MGYVAFMHLLARFRIAVVLCASVLTACGSHAAAPTSKPPLAVDVAPATRADIASYLSLDGQVAPFQESVLSSAQSGIVRDVLVSEGQSVRRGQLLARLDDALLVAQLAQQRSLVAQSEAHLRASTLQRDVTSLGAESTVSTAEQQLAAARNNVAAAQAALENAELTYQSNQQLLAQGYVAQTAFEGARSSYVSAQQSLANAKEQQRQAEVALRAARSSGRNAVPLQDQQIASDHATLDGAKAAVQLLQTQIAQTRIVAPFDGIVTQRLLDPGAYAGPNQPVVRISQIDRVYVNVNVPDADLTIVRAGTPVTFRANTLSARSFSGTVFDVNAIPATGTLSYRARLIEDNADQALRGGMLVSVQVRKDFHPATIVVPRSAVFQSDAGAIVYVASQTPASGGASGTLQAKAVPVKLGIQTDTLSEVESDQIGPGTQVIVTRPDALQDKSAITIVGAGGHQNAHANTAPEKG